MAPVHEAARRNDVRELRRLLDLRPELLEAESDGWPQELPLHTACDQGSLEAVCYLLDRGAGIDHEDADRATPLRRACIKGHAEVVRLLVARGADPTLQDNQHWTVLMEASCADGGPYSNHVAVIRLLLEDGRVPVNACGDHERTALWLACSRGHVERALVLLLEGRADPSMAHGFASGEMLRPFLSEGRRQCQLLLRWFERELEKPFLLSKARAVADARESISKAPEKVGARTEAEAQKAREEAAPEYLRGRVERQEVLPSVEVVGQEEEEDEEDEECEAVLKFVVMTLKEDLHVDLMEGLRLSVEVVDGEQGEHGVDE